MEMKDLEALGWKITQPDSVHGVTRQFKAGPIAYHVFIGDCDGVAFIVSIYRTDKVVTIPFDTLDQAVAFANSAACVTPDNPKGRWVE